MAVANVILAISSKAGPGGLASLQAGIQMLTQMAKALIDGAKEADRYSTIYKNLTVSINQADVATKGLIDTTELMANANKFAQSNIKVTEEQLADVAKVAVDYAKATGTDATQAMTQFTEAITRNRTTALKQFGIEVKAGKTSLETFTNAIELVSEKAEGITIELENTTEKFFAIGNQIGTATGNLAHFYNITTQGEGALDILIDGLAEANEGFESMFDLAHDLGQEFIDLDSIISGLALEIQILFADNEKEAAALEKRANERLKRMRQNEQRFRERTGRSSVRVGGGREEIFGPEEEKKRKRRRKGKGKKRPTIEEDLFEHFEERDEEALPFEEGALFEDESERRRTEIERLEAEKAFIINKRAMQAEINELKQEGIETGEMEGILAALESERDPELRMELFEMAEQEFDLKQRDREFELEFLESKMSIVEKLWKKQFLGAKILTAQFNILGNATQQYFSAFMAGTTMSGNEFLKMIGRMAAQEAVYWGIQAAIKGVQALYHFISPYGNKQEGAAAATAAAGYAINAVALGAFAAIAGAAAGGLRGGGGGGGGGAAGGSGGPSVGGGGSREVGAPSEGFDADKGKVEIEITLRDGAEGLFNAVMFEEKARRVHGQPSIAGSR
jgi:hypothetical protein